MLSNGDFLILVADDDPEVIKLYEKGLNFSHTTVLTATTLDQLSEAFDEHTADIDVIVLDGCIPGDTLNTISFIERARTGGFKNPIIAASSSHLYQQKMMDSGCSHQADKVDAIDYLWGILG